MTDDAQSVLRSVDTQGMSDEELARYANLLADYEGEEVVMRYFARMKDKLAATKARFDYYNSRSHRNRPYMEKALAEIPELKKAPAYAGTGLAWSEGTLLEGLGRYEEAIKAYRAANREPDSTWAIKDCLVALKQYPQAIKLMREIETVGGGVAARASLEIANILRASGDKSREVDQLRIVLKRYPKSGESSEAHRRLETYGVALIGGEAEAED
jgi:tetratricopeptide (TPR) repeat protein